MSATVLVAESLAPGNGGICRVARLIARTLQTLSTPSRAVVLSDVTASPDLSIVSACCAKSRAKFVSRVQLASLSRNRFVYDSPSLARAHCRVPLLKRPSMVFMHGIEIWEGARPEHLKTLRDASMTICVSSYSLQRARQHHGGFDNARVCWLATEEDDLPATPRKLDGPPTALILGRIDEQYKGHRELIECWPRVVDSVPGAKLVIAGRGPRFDEMKSLASSSPVGQHIELPGFVPESQIDALWARTSVMVMPSRGEGFGLVYIEAMRWGIPVIASIHDAGAEVNVDGVTGYNINKDAPEELPERIIQLLQNADLAQTLGHAGQQRWRQHFRLSSFVSRFSPFLSEFGRM